MKNYKNYIKIFEEETPEEFKKTLDDKLDDVSTEKPESVEDLIKVLDDKIKDIQIKKDNINTRMKLLQASVVVPSPGDSDVKNKKTIEDSIKNYRKDIENFDNIKKNLIEEIDKLKNT